jgi:hypothetical protein
VAVAGVAVEIRTDEVRGSGSGGGSGWVAVAVAGWQWGGVAGEKMEGIGGVLRELWVFVAVAVAGVAVAWQWLGW